MADETAVVGGDDSVGQLEEQARKRRERLRALKETLQGGGPVDLDTNEKKLDAPLPKPIFRSYNPQDENFQESARPKALPIDIEDQVADTLEKGHVKTLLDDVDLSNLAPRKPDWDLKRDIAPKLAKLERRTQKAIAELILERLKTNQDLAATVELADSARIAHLQDDD